MTRETDTAARLAVLLVFLKNGNQALNVSRIATKLKEQGISEFTKSSENEAMPVEPTVATVSAACQDLCGQGLLEMMVVVPLRSPRGRKTPIISCRRGYGQGQKDDRTPSGTIGVHNWSIPHMTR